MRWITLSSVEYYVLPALRRCGTPGCTLHDFHEGAHSTEMSLCHRRHAAVPRVARRSPRLHAIPFAWCDLSLDMQAAILLQLGESVDALLMHMAWLARNLRALRPVVLRVLQVDTRCAAALNTTWCEHSLKSLQAETPLKCMWRYTHLPLDELVKINLQLIRPIPDAPRSWRWSLQLKWHVRCDACLKQIVLLNANSFYSSKSSLGVTHGRQHRCHRKLLRAHNFEVADITGSGHDMLYNSFQHSDFILLRLYTIRHHDRPALHMQYGVHPLFRWSIPRRTECVMWLVFALAM